LLPLPIRAQSASSVFQTDLVTEKSSCKINEMVYAKLVLYNPTAQRMAVHFSGGCWFSFVVRDMLGTVIHNETWPACDPDINGYENTTNVMLVDPGGGRWFPMTWNQLDGMGKHVPVPADYVLSWSFKNPDPPIREASKTITLTDQVQSQLEAFSASAFRFLQDFPPVVWFCGICRNDSVVPGVETDKDLRQTHDVCACCSIGNRNPHPHPRVLLQPAPLLGDSMSGDNLPPQQHERLSADHSDNLGNTIPYRKNGP